MSSPTMSCQSWSIFGTKSDFAWCFRVIYTHSVSANYVDICEEIISIQSLQQLQSTAVVSTQRKLKWYLQAALFKFKRCVHCHHRYTAILTLKPASISLKKNMDKETHKRECTLCTRVCVCCLSFLPVEVCDDVFEDLVVDGRKLFHNLPQCLQTLHVVHDF